MTGKAAYGAFFPLEGLLHHLREHGFPVGLDSYIRVQHLLDRLDPETEASRLPQLLCPLFARNAREQQRFYQVYREWEELGGQSAAPSMRPLVPAQRRSGRPAWQRLVNSLAGNLWLGLGFALLTLLLVGYVGARVYFALRGDPQHPGMQEYFEAYHLTDKETFGSRSFRYLANAVFFLPQACDDMAGAELRVEELIPLDSNRFRLKATLNGLAPDAGTRTEWQSGQGGGAKDSLSFTYIYRDTGQAMLRVILTNAYGCRRELSRSLSLRPQPSCQADFGWVQDPRNPALVTFTDSSTLTSGQLREWSWRFGDKKGSEASGAVVSFEYEEYQEYKVCLRIRTDAGCEDELCRIIRLRAPADSVSLLPMQPAPFIPADPTQLSPLSLKPYLPSLLLLVGLLVIGFFYELYHYFHRKSVLDAERPDDGPLTWPLSLPAQPALWAPGELQEAARHLRRRQAIETRIPDIPATIEASLQAGGYPTFRFLSGSRPPEYLALIESQGPRDHLAAWFARLMQEIARQDVFVELFFHDPAFESFFRAPGERALSLGDLQARFPEHRLLILGEGQALSDPINGGPSRLLFELGTWSEKALVTPRPPARWGLAEAVVSAYFPVLPAGLGTFARLLDQLDPEKMPPRSSQLHWDDLPEGRQASDPQAWREYLGETCFSWLAACALHTECHWDLTLRLGQLLESEDGLPRLQEEPLLRLARLPFFRRGLIPDELRMALSETLAPEGAARVRQRIIEVLREGVPPANSLAAERIRAQITVHEWEMGGGGPTRRAALRERMATLLDREEVEDALALRHARHGKKARKPGRLPWRLLFFRSGMPILGLKPWLRISLALFLIGLMVLPSALESLPSGLDNWARIFRKPGKIIEINGSYYLLANARDSARYFSYLGGKAYDSAQYSSAYNLFKLASQRDPFEGLYYYQRGLANYRLISAAATDSLLEETYSDFLRARVLQAGYERDSAWLMRQEAYAGISSGDISPDGQRRALALPGDTRLLDARDSLIALLPHPTRVSFLRFAASGALLSGAGSQLRLWAEDGSLEGSVSLGSQPLRAAALSPDGEYLLSGHDDGRAALWNRRSRQKLQELRYIHTGALLEVGFSPDQRYLLLASADSSASLWSRSTGEFINDYDHPDAVVSAAFTPDSRWIISATRDGGLHVWDIGGEQLRSIRTPFAQVYRMTLSPDGNSAALAGRRSFGQPLEYLIWDWARDSLVLTLTLPGGSQRAVGLTDDEAHVSFLAGGGSGAFFAPTLGIYSFRLRARARQPLIQASQFNEGLLLYRRKRFEAALRVFRRLEAQGDSSAPTYFTRFLAGFYLAQQDAEASAAQGWQPLSDAIGDLQRALRRNPAYRDSARPAIPLLIQLISSPQVPRELQLRFCNQLESIQPGACALRVYDELRAYREGRAAVRQDERWGYLDLSRSLVIPLQYSQASDFLHGLAIVRKDAGEMQVIDSTGGRIPTTSGRAARNAGEMQVIDSTGQTVYDLLLPVSEGLYPVRRASDGKWGYLDVGHDVHVAPRFDQAGAFRRGYAVVRLNGLYGIIDRSGNPEPMGGIRYTRIVGDFGRDSVLSAYIGSQRVALSLSRGAERRVETLPATPQQSPQMPAPGAYRVLGAPSEGLLRAADASGRQGFLRENFTSQSGNPSAQVAIPFIYEEARDFRAGRAAVKTPGGLWGFIDMYGKSVTPFVYDEAFSFEEIEKQTAALVLLDGRRFFITLSGECISLRGLSCPAAPSLPTKSMELPVRDYLDPESQMIVFTENGKWGLKRGDQTVVAQAQYSNRLVFTHGLARAQLNGKWGFIRPDGSQVIPFEYDDAQDFSEELAAVKKGDKWGYINTQGKLVIGLLFDAARPFQQGRAIVREGRIALRIDKNGRRLTDKKGY